MEQKIINLEERITYLEQTNEEFNQVIYKQQLQIDNLKSQIKSLIKKNEHTEDTLETDETPPHY
ncbi:hypothetical protein MNB_SUP05-5-163 [hydrothermal vent metagenome]|uniref:SlyX protein n=1 Tax=hydrothermal vent metagenome TaxID=652676 RepID=A0A1W1BIU2_9ZZZZ